ncbi:hypothetical protein DI392_01060 [Vibrio albus]|uniref:EAL domain-containing protein n=1 Tax=Vibrio albus TaxID=2200953 RepID=A0A2U3BDL5_9VIBR|nr:EAL domain-containing protein [Vibrio albus]PWI34899.1 hypothetical protein DI392_01060 [Vibrio albus]
MNIIKNKKYFSTRNGNHVSLFQQSNCGCWAEIEFLLFPVKSLNPDRVEYYEIVTQVIEQSGESLGSVDFFENVEDSLITEITRNQLDYINENPNKYRFSINITLKSLLNYEFYIYLLNKKDRDIILEINEFQETEGSEQSLLFSKLSKLQSIGYKLCLDGFNHHIQQACSSLGIVMWDYIKLDKYYLVYNVNRTDELNSLIKVLIPFVKHSIILNDVCLQIHDRFAKINKLLVQGYYYTTPVTLIQILKDNMERRINDKSKEAFFESERI